MGSWITQGGCFLEVFFDTSPERLWALLDGAWLEKLTEIGSFRAWVLYFLIALARGFIKAKEEEDYKGFLKGAAQAGAAQLLIASASAMIGGPALRGILISIFILVMLKKIYEQEITKETISQITRRVDETLKTLIKNPIGTAQ